MSTVHKGKIDIVEVGPRDGFQSVKCAPITTEQKLAVIDRLADAALRRGAGSFRKAFEPVLKIIEKAKSLEELRAMMEDDKAVAGLFAAMDVSQAEELLQKVMLYADLEGRALEDGRH